jgi:tetratricopeptide (TPR) repeat protein
MALWQQGRVEEAAQVFDAARRLAEPLGGEEPGATILDHLAMALDNLDRTHESIPYFRQAVVLSQDRVQRSARLVNLGAALVNVGLAREGIGPLLEARQTLRQVAGAADTERHALAQLGNAQAILARYTEALADLEAARALTEAHGLPRGFVHLMLARTLIPLGQYAEAERHLQTTLEQPNLRPILHTRALITLGRLRALSGEPAAALFERAGGLLDASHPWLVALLGLDRSVVAAPEPALAFAEAARQTAYRYQLHGLAVGASTRAAQALLRLGRPAEALARVQEAVTLLEAYDPTDFYPGEVLWTHYRALRDNHHPAASAALQEALRWVRAASRQVPEAYRESFLYLNPVNRSLLEAAGLPIGGSG